MHSKYGRHHMYQYFHAPKRPCGGKAKLMKLCLYTVLIQYCLCTKKQLLTDTTTYLNFQPFNSSLTTFVHAVVSPIKNKSWLQEYTNYFELSLRFSVTQKQQILQSNRPIYCNNIKTSSIVELQYACENALSVLLITCQFSQFMYTFCKVFL